MEIIDTELSNLKKPGSNLETIFKNLQKANWKYGYGFFSSTKKFTKLDSDTLAEIQRMEQSFKREPHPSREGISLSKS